MERIDIRYALAEVARDKRFVESLQWRSEEIFFARENLAACVVDGTYSIKIWTWLMKWKTYQGHEFEKCSGPSVQALPLPSRVSFSRARFFLCPLLPLPRLFPQGKISSIPESWVPSWGGTNTVKPRYNGHWRSHRNRGTQRPPLYNGHFFGGQSIHSLLWTTFLSRPLSSVP